MSVFRINKNSNYTTMSNYHLKDKNLSLKAKGLLSVMLSLNDDWNYSVAGLCSISKENETAINSALKELKNYGYLVVSKERKLDGKFEYNYDIFERPTIEKPLLENPTIENMGVVNNININNTKEVNTKDKILNNKENSSIINNTKEKTKNPEEIIYDYYYEKAIKFDYAKRKSDPNGTTLTHIKKHLKEHSIEEIKMTIDRYFKVINDKDYFFNTYWSAEKFFKQGNTFNDFLEEGSKWINYKLFKEKQKSYNPYQKGEISRETKYPELDDIGYIR